MIDPFDGRRVHVPKGVDHRTVKELLIKHDIAITGGQGGIEGCAFLVKSEDVERARQLVAEIAARV